MNIWVNYIRIMRKINKLGGHDCHALLKDKQTSKCIITETAIMLHPTENNTRVD